MTKLSVTLPDGSVATRRTAHAYTHVLAVRSPGKEAWTAFSWHHTEAAAHKKVAEVRRNKWSSTWETQIVLVGA